MKPTAFLVATLSLLLLIDDAFAAENAGQIVVVRSANQRRIAERSTTMAEQQQSNVVFLLADDLGDGELELYELTADPAESNNVAARHPDVVRQLSAKLEAWVATLPKEYLKTKDKDD